MKIIVAIIRPYKLEAVKAALGEAVESLFVTEVRGFGRQLGHSEIYRGAEYKVEFVVKLRLEIICEDAEAEGLIARVSGGARTDKIGDGKIFLSRIGNVVNIGVEEPADAMI